MNLQEIEKKIEEYDFPVFPQMLVQVKNVTSDESASAQDLAEIILKDPALTSKILSVANSAYYGFYGKVSTITQAIVVLGFESVKNIALGITVYNTLSNYIKAPSIKQFWEHSLATGVCAELLAEKLGHAPTEEALVGGLIHDVGKLILVQFYPEEYSEVERIVVEHDAYYHVVETSILGVSHCEVGRLMVRKWGLPDVLLNVVSDHHKKDWGVSALTDIIAFSDFMIQALAANRGPDDIEQLINMGATVLNLKKETITVMTQLLAERLDEYCRIFEIRIDNLMAYTTMVEEEYARLKKSSTSKQISRKEEETSILSEVSKSMIQGRPPEEIHQMLLEGIIRIEGAEVAVLLTVDPSGERLCGKLGLGKQAMEFCAEASYALDDEDSALARAVSTKHWQFLDRPEEDGPPAGPVSELLGALQVASIYVFPLYMQEKSLGVFVVGWRTSQQIRQDSELQTLGLFANQAALVLGTAVAADQKKTKTKPRRSSLLLDLD
ncbi:MAG: HDOD domain-containing protein [Deltaproteobacteria bacterium]|nr:HDOD domain-containing protein [Deltaproteobacteria bacterium]